MKRQLKLLLLTAVLLLLVGVNYAAEKVPRPDCKLVIENHDLPALDPQILQAAEPADLILTNNPKCQDMAFSSQTPATTTATWSDKELVNDRCGYEFYIYLQIFRHNLQPYNEETFAIMPLNHSSGGLPYMCSVA